MKSFNVLFLQNLNFLEFFVICWIYIQNYWMHLANVAIFLLFLTCKNCIFLVRRLRYLLLWWIHKRVILKELFGCDSFKHPQRTSGFHERTGGSQGGHLTFPEKKGVGVGAGGGVENWVTRYQNLGI
jgi:hypothetical protein